MMYLAAVLTVVGYFVIAIGKRTKDPVRWYWWPSLSDHTGQYHAALGITSVILLFLQITIPWVVPRHKLTLKLVYYKFHIIIGGLSYALGCKLSTKFMYNNF